MNGGAIIAAILQDHQVRHLFTLCGGHIAPIYTEAAKVGIRVIDVRHEASAVFAADAVARLSGIPGVVAVTAGPGVTNTITALQNARMAQSPLVLFGGATATLLRNRGALQDIDQISILKSVVKWTTTVKRLADLAPAVQEGFRQATEGVPGPVFIECPVDLLYPEATVREWYGQKNNPGSSLGARLRHWYINRHVNRLFRLNGPVRLVNTPVSAGASHANHDIHRALKALSLADRPVLVMGSGSMTDPGKAQALATAVRKLGIPVYLSGMARGLLGQADPLQCLHERKKALKAADCIVLAGVPADFRLDYGRQFNRTARLIAISRNKPDLTMNMPAVYLARQTDPARFLVALAASASGLPDWSDWKKTLQEYQQSRETGIDNMAAESMAGINPVALFRTLGKALPPNSVLVADGGDFAATASYTLRPGQPLHWLDPGVFGTLGAGGGFALGAALQYHNDYVWIIYGDGSAAYSLAEFDILTRHHLKVCAIIGNNGSWEQIARDQVDILGSDVAVNLPQSDYQHIGAAFGAAGERVENLKDFEQAVQNAIQSMDRGVPYIINAVIGKSSFRKGSISM